jgi:hypothetical protein
MWRTLGGFVWSNLYGPGAFATTRLFETTKKHVEDFRCVYLEQSLWSCRNHSRERETFRHTQANKVTKAPVDEIGVRVSPYPYAASPYS